MEGDCRMSQEARPGSNPPPITSQDPSRPAAHHRRSVFGFGLGLTGLVIFVLNPVISFITSNDGYTSGKAIESALSLPRSIPIILPLGICALVLGHRARQLESAAPSGRHLARWASIFGWANIALSLLAVVVAAVVFAAGMALTIGDAS
jgi:hypothetical protein